MITVNYMKPFYTKATKDGKLRLVFAEQYFSIDRGGKIYHFVPLEAREIIVDLDKELVVNLSDVFVFKGNGDKLVRLPIYQMMLISNIHEFLQPIINYNMELRYKSSEVRKKSTEPPTHKFDYSSEDIDGLFKDLEQFNTLNATLLGIDMALENRDEKAFYELSEKLISIQNTIS